MISGGILSGVAIRNAVELGDIEIEPFDPKQLNPCSYDLRLGDYYAMYDDIYLDAKIQNNIQKHKIDNKGITLNPEYCYLMHTQERIFTKKYVPIVDGKSSIGRLFIQIHCTAGYGDAGFFGQYTLEVLTHKRVKVYQNMLFAQIRFHTIVGEIELYKGNYQGEASMGPVASKSWKQFLDK